jgi:hypothetical protein
MNVQITRVSTSDCFETMLSQCKLSDPHQRSLHLVTVLVLNTSMHNYLFQ